METNGRLGYCSSGVIMIRTNGNLETLEKLEELKEEEVTVRITKRRKKRSLDANAYYFKLVDEIAAERKLSVAEVHNRTLAELGIPWLDEEGNKTFIMMRDDDTWLKSLPYEPHYCPTFKTMEDKNGELWRWFYLLKPSRFMDTVEMGRLISYIVQDAQSLGIETKTPEELERLKGKWGTKDISKSTGG